MELFKSNKLMFKLFFIYPLESNSNSPMKYFAITYSAFVITVQILCLVGSFLQIIEFMSTDLSQVLFVILQISAICSATFMLIIGITVQRKISNVMEMFQKIYDSSKKRCLFNEKNPSDS